MTEQNTEIIEKMVAAIAAEVKYAIENTPVFGGFEYESYVAYPLDIDYENNSVWLVSVKIDSRESECKKNEVKKELERIMNEICKKYMCDYSISSESFESFGEINIDVYLPEVVQ